MPEVYQLDCESQHAVSWNRTGGGGTIAQLVGNVNPVDVASVHVLQGCIKALDEVRNTAFIGRTDSFVVNIAIVGGIESQTVLITGRGQQLSGIVNGHRIGIVG